MIVVTKKKNKTKYVCCYVYQTIEDNVIKVRLGSQKTAHNKINKKASNVNQGRLCP